MARDRILLESGTNEVEILEFALAGQNFGVNVLKIQAIEQFDPARITRVQLAHPSIVGTLLFRESCITLVDLRHEMDPPVTAADPGGEPATSATEPDGTEPGAGTEEMKLVLVMEFNNLKTAFIVDEVNRIHRVSWESINPLSAFLNTPDSKFTGSLQIEDREILIVDMEKIVTEIMPSEQSRFAIVADADNPNFAGRADQTVFLAEDSAVIREKVQAELAQANYTDVRTFANGKECYDEIMRLTEQGKHDGTNITDHVDALISDIEMPAMDGLALCRAIKADQGLRELPVIMFSSLINEQIARKCEDVEADAYISKPQFTELVALLDGFTVAGSASPA